MVDDKEKKWTDADITIALRDGWDAGARIDTGWSSEKWLQQYKESKQKYKHIDQVYRIEEADTKLGELGIPETMIGKTISLAFLALCGIKPDMKWSEATRTSIGNRAMVQFAIDNYGLKEHSNNRDQFRREAINILLNYELIDMNPDNKSLGPNSPLTHYSIKQKVLNKIKQ